MENCIDMFNELNKLDNKELYEKAIKIEIPEDYHYKKLCQRVLKYYNDKGELSFRQRSTLIYLIIEFGE